MINNVSTLAKQKNEILEIKYIFFNGKQVCTLNLMDCDVYIHTLYATTNNNHNIFSYKTITFTIDQGHGNNKFSYC